MYVQDYDEIFCLGQNANGRWYQLMQPYINNDQILFCPSEPAKNLVTAGISAEATRHRTLPPVCT